MNEAIYTSLCAAREKLIMDAISLEDKIVASTSAHATRQLLSQLHDNHFKSAEIAIQIRDLVLAEPAPKTLIQKLLRK